MPSAVNRLIVAFDEPELSKALALGRQLRGLARYAKIGSIVFTAAGPRAIRRFAALGFSIFLDLKFHDIPSTVEKSCCAAARQGVSLLTVHACGQPQMLEAALTGARAGAREAGVPRPRVLGVTVLTSVGEGRAPAITKTAVERALQARRMGLDGVVASPHEAAAIRRRIARPFLIVCPGIRLPAAPPGVAQAGPSLAAKGDQRRVATPAAALAHGADLLVVGRPITQARRPRLAAQQMLAAMEA